MAKYVILIILNTGFYHFAYPSQQYELFEKDNRYGLRDLEGKVTIPAVYDQLGWSDGSTELFHNLIGYQLEGSWGLVSVNNKLVTSNKYYRLQPLNSSYIKASIKGSFSNLLFNGLIDKKGQVVLSCYYFDVQQVGPFFKVSNYEAGTIKSGLLNEQFDRIVPIAYKEVTLLSDESMVASKVDGKSYFYHKNGDSDRIGYDDYQVIGNVIRLKRTGRYGLSSLTSLSAIHPVAYKGFDEAMNPIPFPSWSITDLDLDSAAYFNSDSVDIKDRLFITHINGNQEVIIDGTRIFKDREVILRYAYSGYLIAEDRYTRKWTLATTSGKTIIDNQDSISFDGTYFGAKGKEGWQVFNRFGRKLSIKSFQSLGKTTSNLLPVRRNDFWALMDFQGEFVTNFKFDRIAGGHSNRVLVDYLGSYGLIDAFGDWVIKPALDSMFMTENLVFGRSGKKWSIFDLDGTRIRDIYSTKICDEGNYISYSSEEGLTGLLSRTGDYLADPIYDTVGQVGDFLFGKREGYVSLFSLDGRQMISANEGIQDIHNEGDELYKITKDERIGYVDSEARLRIANRYDDGGLFQENRLPVKLLGRWGYVDRYEQLVIQPIYDSAGTFINGLAIVMKNEAFGLIDLNGEELLSCEYEVISRTSGGGFVVKKSEGAWGALDSQGSTVLTPNYDEIKEATNGLLMVNRNGTWGVINSEGYVKVPFDYQEIKQVGDYLMFKKLANQ